MVLLFLKMSIVVQRKRIFCLLASWEAGFRKTLTEAWGYLTFWGNRNAPLQKIEQFLTRHCNEKSCREIIVFRIRLEKSEIFTKQIRFK